MNVVPIIFIWLAVKLFPWVFSQEEREAYQRQLLKYLRGQ